MDSYDFDQIWLKVKKITKWNRQSELADFLGVQAGAVSNAKSKGVFRDSWLIQIAKEFNCSIEDLTGTAQQSSQQTQPPEHVSKATEIPRMPSDDIGMAEGMAILGRIYSSGDQVFIRAINANLHAFNAALDNKAMAQKAIDMMDEMNQRLLAMENSLAQLKRENEELRNRPPGCAEQANG